MRLLSGAFVIMAVLMSARSARRIVGWMSLLRDPATDAKRRADIGGFLVADALLLVGWCYVFWMNSTRIF